MSEAGREPLVCGFLNVLKPPGMTSAQVVGFVRRLMCGGKVGHAGTLDPEAAGVLPLMAGKAARLFDYLQDKEKAYVAEVAFGCATDTQDAQGIPLERSGNCPTEQAIRDALPGFAGTIWQRPPMFSAIKQDGKRLYALAREGKQAEVPKRQVTVHGLSLLGTTERYGALLSVQCSKGFYVRTLCHDLGQALGCPAHMRFLLRTRSGVFTLETAKTLESLEAAARQGKLEDMLLPPEVALGHLHHVQVPQRFYAAFSHGGRLPWREFPSLQGTPAEQGKPFGLWWGGKLAAVGERQGDEVKLRTWLAD